MPQDSYVYSAGTAATGVRKNPMAIRRPKLLDHQSTFTSPNLSHMIERGEVKGDDPEQ